MAGIQKQDVFEAADALVLAGERPTIERVRLRLGRGSPNTVSPMLDEWFKGLGARLSAAKEQAALNGDSPPDALQTAARRMWEVARREAAQTLEAPRAELDQARQRLNDDRAAFDAEVARHREYVGSLQTQVGQLTQQLEHAQGALRARDTLLASLREEAQAERERAAQVAQKLTATVAQASDERQRLQEQHGARERHLMLELDQAREAVRSAHAQLQALRASATKEQAQLAAEWSSRHESVMQARQESQALAQRLQVQLEVQTSRAAGLEELCTGLRAQLAQQARLAQDLAEQLQRRDEVLGGLQVQMEQLGRFQRSERSAQAETAEPSRRSPTPVTSAGEEGNTHRKTSSTVRSGKARGGGR